ncbi:MULTISPECIES: hypothetical protein [Komagataeibacter]|uniref:hypothetical protein n=1 Tax=Komagataeibacter TaxID=1434011 RepID=UPI000207FF09|nr:MULTISPECIES: hypothetical protein [Komagataeibacter]EGG79205.1 hypothetical protein SXCC_00121 [Gluconacetobacter sp. SXCC-1]
MPDAKETRPHSWAINRCSVATLAQIRDESEEYITREWDAFIQRATDFDIEHFVLFDCFLFDDADLDAVDHAKRLACRSLVISEVIDGNVIIGFATKQSMEDFIDWGNDAIRAHCPKSLNHTGPTLEERA